MNWTVSFAAPSIIVFLSGFPTESFSGPASCTTTVKNLGIEVENFYKRVKINIGPTGTIAVPIASKAFIFWRQNTPPWIPDSAFAFHYLTKESVKDVVALNGRAELQNAIDQQAITSVSKHDLIIPEPLNLLGIESLETVMSTLQGSGMYMMKYLVFQDGEEIIVILLPSNWSHESVAAKILNHRPNLKLVTGRFFDIDFRINDQTKKFDQLFVSAGGPALDFIHHDLTSFLAPEEFRWHFDEQKYIEGKVKQILGNRITPETHFVDSESEKY